MIRPVQSSSANREQNLRVKGRMGFVSSLGRDLRFALRQMRQTPIVSGVALLSLALGHWRQRRDLLARQRADPQAAAGVRAGSAGDRRPRATRRGPQHVAHQSAVGIPPRSPGGPRRRRRVRQSALQSELRRRDAQRAGAVRQRPLLRHARRHAAHRPAVHGRRRSARRRTGWPGRGAELRILAARVRRHAPM